MIHLLNTINSIDLSSPLHHSASEGKAYTKFLFVLLLTGIAIVSSSFQNENLLTKSVPFKGKFKLAHAATGVLLNGEGSHVGRFTLFAPYEGNTSTITAANGHQIFTTYTVSALNDLGGGMVQVDLDNTITGGTGRFAGTTGSFVISALVNENVGRGDGTFEGTISY
jgi:hypothetical protein